MGNLRILIVILILCLVSGLDIMAAEYDRICGTVFDRDSLPLPGAKISIVIGKDTVFNKDWYSGTKGEYTISEIHAVSIDKIICSKPGYSSEVSPMTDGNINFYLQKETTTLEEFVVTATHESLVYSPGKMIYNPGILKTQVPSVFSLLRFVPGLEVAGKTITMSSSQCEIWINGRNPRMSKELLEAKIQSLEPENIIDIEIISGNASNNGKQIVNINVTDPYTGFREMFGADFVSETAMIWPKANFTIDYNKGGFKATLVGAYSYYHNKTIKETDYYYKEEGKKVFSRSEDRSMANTVRGNLSMSYSTKRSVTGVSFGIEESNLNAHDVLTSRTVRDIEDEITHTYQQTKVPFRHPEFSANAYYELYPDNKGSKFDVNFNYSYKDRKNDTGLNFEDYDEMRDEAYLSSGLEARTSYTHRFSSTTSLAAGYEIIESRKNDRRSSIFSSATSETASHESFRFKELINAAYMEFATRIGESFSFNTGLRWEYTYINGKVPTAGYNVKNNYHDLVPSITLQYSLGRYNNILNFAYSSYIFRPFYSEYNPFITQNSPNVLFEGNPDLRSGRSDNLSLGFIMSNGLSFSVSTRFLNKIPSAYSIPVNDGVTKNGVANIGRKKEFGISVAWNKSFFGIWTLQTYLSAKYNIQKAIIDNYNLGYHNFEGFCTIKNIFLVSKKHKWNMSLACILNSPIKTIDATSKFKHLLYVTIDKAISSIGYISLYFGNLTMFRNDKSLDTPFYSYSTHRKGFPLSTQINISFLLGKKRVNSAMNLIPFSSYEQRSK